MPKRASRLYPLLTSAGLIFACAALVFFTNYRSFTGSKNAPAAKLDQDIAQGEVLVATHPPLVGPYTNLAALYLQKVRETLDPSYYDKIGALMAEASKIDPNDSSVDATRAAAADGRHDFQKGYAEAEAAVAKDPNAAVNWGLLGDADIELGKYQDAMNAFQKMVDIRPDFASLSRIAYIRELYGDIAGAREALRTSINYGSSYQENVAWAYVELGKLHLRDDPASATGDFNGALQVLPTYTQAMEGLGKVAFAKGDMAGTEKYFKQAYDGQPLAQYAIDLGDAYASEGATSSAAQYYALAQAAFDTSAKSGIDSDLEESLFLSDHDLRLPDALAMALRAYNVRPNQYAADYLAWALYKNGQTPEALKYRSEALRLGDIDPLILFHQGMIALGAGDTAAAKKYLSKSKSIAPNLLIQDTNLNDGALRDKALASL